MNRKNKFLDLKVEGEDFIKIKLSVMNSITNLRQNLYNDKLEPEDKEMIRKEIDSYKSLLSKLDICELYNEDKFNYNYEDFFAKYKEEENGE